MDTTIPFVRLLDLTLNHFKNVGYGHIDMPQARAKDYFSHAADVLGIYGQNGSGKTSVIQALHCLGDLWRGASVKRYASCITAGEQEGSITCTLAVDVAGVQRVVRYSVTLRRTEDGCCIYRESLEYAPCKVRDGKYRTGRYTAIARFEEEELPRQADFLPTVTFKEWAAQREDLRKSYLSTKVLCYASATSYLFAPQAFDLFCGTMTAASCDVLKALACYAKSCMTFIGVEQTGVVSLNLLEIHLPENIGHGVVPFTLDAPNVLPMQVYPSFQKLLEQLNIVLRTIIPDMSLGIHELGKELYEPQTPGSPALPAMRFELESVRGALRFPLKSESDGIKRLLCILGPLVDMYNKPGTLVAIDELDSGIFEYLLGELLSILAMNAKGQLIFTSHNLRPLEMLDKELVLFSTTNPENRYIRFTGIRANNNLRDLYIRDINLHSQREEIYARTDSSRINRAFRRAGKEAR